MTIPTDSSGQPYVEIEYHGGYIRLTYVENSDAWGGINAPAVRVHTRDGGNVRQGPEIPVEILFKVAGKMADLLSDNRESLLPKLLTNLISESSSK